MSERVTWDFAFAGKFALAAFITLGLAACDGRPASKSAAPMRFCYGGATYSVPTSYLASPKGELPPALAVVYPGFQPARSSPADCIRGFGARALPRCTTFDFVVTGSKGAGPEERARNSLRWIPPSMLQSRVDVIRVYRNVGPQHSKYSEFHQKR